jgi:hypothetical protein
MCKTHIPWAKYEHCVMSAHVVQYHCALKGYSKSQLRQWAKLTVWNIQFIWITFKNPDATLQRTKCVSITKILLFRQLRAVFSGICRNHKNNIRGLNLRFILMLILVVLIFSTLLSSAPLFPQTVSVAAVSLPNVHDNMLFVWHELTAKNSAILHVGKLGGT